MNVLMSGPIRPSEDAVLEVIQSIRSQFPGCRIFLSTWTESARVREAVDVYEAVREPTHEEIARIVTAKTIQQRQVGLADDKPCGRFPTFKMYVGVQNVCNLARPYLQDTDRVIRIRTDSMFQFDPEYLQSLLASNPATYIAKRGDGFDWFAMTTFSILVKAWCFANIQEYNAAAYNAFNAEGIVQGRVPVPIQYLDPTQVDMYILRENGRKHYYP